MSESANQRISESTNQLANHLIPHWRLGIIILIYVAVAAAHSVIVPLTTGNDEWAHFLYTRFIAEHGRLPATIAEREEAGYKSDAPPLYHLLTAAVTAGVEPTRLLRPLTDDAPRRYLADNIIDSYALVHTAVETPPYRGEVLLWHLGRGVSILFGVTLILLTYLTALEILPTRRLALTAAALVAFIPAVIFHSSVLSYESLSAALAALFLWVAVKAVKQPERWGYWPALGLVAGLSITVKYSAVLLPLELLFIAWLAGQSLKPLVRFIAPRLLAMVAALLLAVSWWFGFLVLNFNTIDTQGPVVGVLQPLLVGDASDTTSVELAAWLFGEDALPADSRPPLPRNYPQLLQTLSDSFWAAPIVGQFILSPWPALIFTLSIVAAGAGWVKLWPTLPPGQRRWLLLLTFHALLITPLLLTRILFSYDPREAAQGRHLLLPAASAIAILLVWGWSRISARLGPGVVAGLLVWSFLGQTGWAAIVYPPPIPVWPAPSGPVIAPARPVNITLADTLRLTAFDWQPTAAGRALAVTLWWQSEAIATQDYLIELTLTGPDGQPLGHSVGHPAAGRYPTRAWESGDRVKDTHYLPLVAVSGGDYPLQMRLLTRAGEPVPGAALDLGLVSLPPGEAAGDGCRVWQAGRELRNPVRPHSTLTVLSDSPPLLRPDDSAAPDETPRVSAGLFHQFIVGPDWAEHYEAVVNGEACAQILVDAPPRNFVAPDLPAAARLNLDFNNELRLLGYDLPARRINPGGRLPLTLYWQALDTMGEDYLIFDNLLDAGQQRWGGYDRRPRDGYSTLRWAPGEVITDAFGVPVDPAAPPGIYTVDVGLYRRVGDTAVPLPVTVEGQPQAQTSVRLGPVKVGGPPPDIVTQNPQPQTEVNLQLGDEITLLGYDKIIVNRKSKIINLKFYWRAERIPAADYTVFLHLRNDANENVAQKDSPPAAGRYPTSLWDAGEIIVDDLTLPVADVPPGEYTPVVGLYNFVDGLRLSVPGIPANEVALPPVQISK